MITPYYDRNGITIYCGDCLEIMPQLDLVFDAIICDLPYGTTACNWDTIIPFEPLWENYKRLVKKNGAVVLFGSEPFSSLLRVSNMDWYKYDWVWKKERPTGFVHAKNKPLKVHENILIFSDGTTVHKNQSSDRMTYNPQMDKGEPYRKKTTSSNIGMMNHAPSKANIDFVGTVNNNLGFRYPISVMSYSIHNVGLLHPTQKPVALLQYLIRTYTNPGDLILDNYIGSGTTLVAAQNEGRRAVGIEISEEYCKIAVDRLRQPSFFSIPDKAEVKPEQLALLDAPQGGAK